MGQVTVKINTDNDAFTPDPHREVCRILEALSTRIHTDGTLGDRIAVRDYNGNLVGSLEYQSDD